MESVLIRLGDRIAQDMIALRLTPPLPLTVAASPEYLATRGTPRTPRDLLDHSCIRYRFQSSGQIAPWLFHAPDGEYRVDVRGNLIVNTLPALVDLARQGLGLVYTFRDCCASELSGGQLIPVLEDHLSDTPGILLYFPREYRSMMALKLFLEHISATRRAASLRAMGADDHGEVGPKTVLGSGESGIQEGDRFRADSSGGRRVGPERGLEFGAR